MSMNVTGGQNLYTQGINRNNGANGASGTSGSQNSSGTQMYSVFQNSGASGASGANVVFDANGTIKNVLKKIETAFNILNEVANNKNEVTISVQEGDPGQENNPTIKTATLPNGMSILVSYNKNGEIERVYITTTKEDYDVGFYRNKAVVDADPNTPGYDTEITNNYDFEKYKKLAEAIFG